jgi:lipid II:glycine glycyltransferase (peptidoglycan interpeptide bridge formation enzyme)
MPIVSLPEWQEFLRDQPNAHLLQTAEWGELKSNFGWTPIRLITGKRGGQILFRKLPVGYTLGYIPKPIHANGDLATNDIFSIELDQLCLERKAIFCKLEPDSWDQDHLAEIGEFKHLRISQHSIQPPRTIVIKIESSEDEILSRMKQKTRYNIRLAEKKGVRVHPWDDLVSFHKMMNTTGERNRFGAHSLEYYRKAYELFHSAGLCELLVAEYEGVPLAALMVFARGNRAWYLYGASTDDQRNLMPTYLLQWEAIRWARSRGCESYDLWGVPDHDEAALEAGFEKRSDGLWGVYRFKRGFGGELKRASPAYDRVYNPGLYSIYRLRMAGREAG